MRIKTKGKEKERRGRKSEPLGFTNPFFNFTTRVREPRLAGTVRKSLCLLAGGKPRGTCSRLACLKARRAELHLVYMRKPEQKAKQAAFQKEYTLGQRLLQKTKEEF